MFVKGRLECIGLNYKVFAPRPSHFWSIFGWNMLRPCACSALCKVAPSGPLQPVQSPQHHLCRDDGRAWVLRYSVRVAAPGCMALVLEAVEDRAPYQLENRTPHPLLYRPVLAPEPGQAPVEFQPLPPWSCVGYAPAVPGGLQRVCPWLTPAYLPIPCALALATATNHDSVHRLPDFPETWSQVVSSGGFPALQLCFCDI